MTREALQDLFAQVSDPTLFLERDGCVAWANAAALRLWGSGILRTPFSALVGAACEKAVCALTAEDAREEQVTVRGKRMNLSAHFCDSEGLCVVSLRACDLLTGAAEAISYATDAAVRSSLSLMLNEANNLAHAVGDRHEFARYPAAFRRAVYQMLRITGDLTLIAAIRSGKVPNMFANETVDALVGEYSSKAEALLKTAGIELSVQPIAEERVITRMDAGLFERAFYAMAANCCTHEGCTHVDVRVRFEAERITLTMADNGAYAPNDSLFLELRNQTDYGTPSVPLFLPLADAVAQYHGGALLLSGSEETGNLVSLRIPRVENFRSQLNSPRFVYDGGIDKALVELSPFLPESCYIR